MEQIERYSDSPPESFADEPSSAEHVALKVRS